MTRASGYIVRHPTTGDLSALEQFAASTIANHRHGAITRRWWWRTDTSACWLAVDASTGEVAACCAARPGHLLVDGAQLPSAGISDWYVSPHHRGAGLGRLLVERVKSDRGVLFATSISESAAAGFARLGWAAQARLALLVGQPAVVAALAFCQRSVAVRSFSPEDIPWSDLDAIWAASTGQALPVMAPRGARNVQTHLAAAGEMRYRLGIASIAGKPLGYALYRTLPAGSIRRFPWARVGLLADFWTTGAAAERKAVLRALAARAAAEAVASGALAIIALATQHWALDGLGRAGFASPRTPVVGPTIGRLSSLAMHNGGGLPGFDGWHLTFADGDTDLLLGG